MANVDDEYVKITLSNKGIMTNPFDANNNPLPPILDKSQLANIDKHFKAFERALQSATNYMVYINDNFKKIDEVTGEAVKSYFLKKSDLANVLPALQRANAQLRLGGYMTDPNDTDSWKASSYLDAMKVEDVKMLTFKRRRAGKLAQSLAEEAVDEPLGGKAYFASPKDRDKEMMSFDIPVTESEINALGGMKEAKKHYGKVLTKVLKDSKSTAYSSAEMKGRNEAQKEEDEKRNQKLAEEENRNRTSLILKGIAILFTIASIARRILASVLSRATDVTKNAQDAIRYSVSPIDAIAYKRMERARGLDEGTTMSAIQTVQDKFGQTDAIANSEDFKRLAPVLTTKVANLVQTGLGKDRPEELMKMIINDFYNQANKGILWTGENVGKEDASRILIDRLAKFSPDMANILATMLYLNNRSTEYKDKIKDFDSLIDLGGEQSSYHLDTRIMEDLGIEIQEVTAKFKTLKENILDKLGTSLAKFVDWASNTEMFMSTEDKAKRRLNAISSLNEASSKSREQSDKYRKIAENYVKSKGIDIDKLGYPSVESWFNAEKFNLNERDRRYIETALRLSAKWREREKKALKESSLSNPQYNKSEYNDFGVMNEVMQEMYHRQGVLQPVSNNEILSAYASVYGKIGAEELLYGENNEDLINVLAKKFKIEGFWSSTKKKNVQKAYKEGIITDKDIQQVLLEKLRSAKQYGTWSTDYSLGLDQEKVEFAYQYAQALAEAKMIETMFFENAIESAIAKQGRALGDRFTVKGASYDERNHTIKVVFDVNGKEITAFEADTWGNYTQTKGEYNINREYANAKK